MIRCALDSPDLGQAFKYLGRYHITHRKFSRANWSRKVSQKLDESQKFRESQLALKSQILYFPVIPKRSFACTRRMIMIRCVLENPDLGQAFKHLWRYHMGIFFRRGIWGIFCNMTNIFICRCPNRSGVGAIDDPDRSEQVPDQCYIPDVSKRNFTHDISMIRRQKRWFLMF